MLILMWRMMLQSFWYFQSDYRCRYNLGIPVIKLLIIRGVFIFLLSYWKLWATSQLFAGEFGPLAGVCAPLILRIAFNCWNQNHLTFQLKHNPWSLLAIAYLAVDFLWLRLFQSLHRDFTPDEQSCNLLVSILWSLTCWLYAHTFLPSVCLAEIDFQALVSILFSRFKIYLRLHLGLI